MPSTDEAFAKEFARMCYDDDLYEAYAASADGEDDDDLGDVTSANELAMSSDPKRHARAQHNALERRRRDAIKDMYTWLRARIPGIFTEKQASRQAILQRSIDYILEKKSERLMYDLQLETEDIEAENDMLEKQLAALEALAAARKREATDEADEEKDKEEERRKRAKTEE